MASYFGVMRAALVGAGLLVPAAVSSTAIAAEPAKPAVLESVELFQAMEDGAIDVQFIPRDATEARVLIENKTDKPLNVRLPAAFAAVPVLAQFGGGGGGGGFGGGGGGGGQGMGGGMGGMGGGGMGGGGMGGGGGGGFFNVAPEKVANFKVACVCLDHGKPDPTPRMQYKLVPVESYVSNQAVIELLKQFGRGGLDRSIAQAATWHLNNGLSWQELAAKRSGRKSLLGREEPYFYPQQLHAAVQLSKAAEQFAAKQDGSSLSQK